MNSFSDSLTSGCGIEQYRHLCDASQYYSALGFAYIDVPWAVQQKVCNSTKPREANPVHHHIRALNHTFHLVASGEQSFLQMQYERAKFRTPLMRGRWQTLTPCFRDEPELDELHRFGFMKLELIDWDNPTVENLRNIIHIAFDFYKKFLNVIIAPNELVHEQGLDILSRRDGIELGSYGIRQREIRGYQFQWVYATGCAEPRLSLAMHNKPPSVL